MPIDVAKTMILFLLKEYKNMKVGISNYAKNPLLCRDLDIFIKLWLFNRNFIIANLYAFYGPIVWVML